MHLCGDKEDMKMTVDSELNRSEIYKVLGVKSTGWGTRNPILLIAKDVENLEKERLKNIEFFDESKFTPVVLEDINTIRKIFKYDFMDTYYLFDFFEGVDTYDINVRELNELCREMRGEIKIQEINRELNTRRLDEAFSNCRPLTEVSDIRVTEENISNLRGTWFVA
jgi:hypothetical protein